MYNVKTHEKISDDQKQTLYSLGYGIIDSATGEGNFGSNMPENRIRFMTESQDFSLEPNVYTTSMAYFKKGKSRL